MKQPQWNDTILKTAISKEDKIFTGIIILIHIIFFLLACQFKRIYMGDSFEYIYEAVNIKDHFFFYSGNPALPVNPEFMTQRQPGYPLFLLSVYLLTINNWLVIILQNIISIFNILYCKHIFTQIGLNKKHNGLLILLLMAYPSQFINANTIAPDILLQTCTVLYFGNGLLLWQKKQLKYALYMSLWLIAGFMVKPVLYPFCIIHFLFLMGYFMYRKTKVHYIILIAIMPLCAVLLYNYDNYIRTGKFHFSSNQSFNAIYYFYTYYSHREGADSAGNFLQRERTAINAIPIYKDRYDYANQRGFTLLKENFFPYLLFHLKNSARMFIEPGKAEIDLFTGKLTYSQLYSKRPEGFYNVWKKEGWRGMGAYFINNRSMLVVIFVFLLNCLRLAGLVMFFYNRNIALPVRIFTFIIISYFAIAAGPIANTRYFLPVSLIAIAAGAMGLARTGKS